jgi:nitroimidazol reductase NimA-like FMN-containing flavoprotein (pyridoxamine 5'-phosphate oxidase superfamily)
MSSFPEVRRKDRLMSAEDAWAFLAGGYSGRLATVGKDGFPYITPLLHVTSQPRIFVHSANTAGHLRTNVDFCPQVCFEVDAWRDLRLWPVRMRQRPRLRQRRRVREHLGRRGP